MGKIKGDESRTRRARKRKGSPEWAASSFVLSLNFLFEIVEVMHGRMQHILSVTSGNTTAMFTQESSFSGGGSVSTISNYRVMQKVHEVTLNSILKTSMLLARCLAPSPLGNKVAGLEISGVQTCYFRPMVISSLQSTLPQINEDAQGTIHSRLRWWSLLS